MVGDIGEGLERNLSEKATEIDSQNGEYLITAPLGDEYEQPAIPKLCRYLRPLNCDFFNELPRQGTGSEFSSALDGAAPRRHP